MAHGAKKVPRYLFETAMMTTNKSLPIKKTKAAFAIAFEEASYDFIVEMDDSYCKRLFIDLYNEKMSLSGFKSQETTFYYNGMRICAHFIIGENNEIAVKLNTPMYDKGKKKNYMVCVTKSGVKSCKYKPLNKLADVFQKFLCNFYKELALANKVA